MALPVEQQLKYWGIAAAVFFVVLWVLGDVILPFILGGAIAYCLDPIADWFERLGFSRLWATIVITILALITVVLLFLIVVPTLVQQAFALAETIPTLFRDFVAFLTERFPQLLDSQAPCANRWIRWPRRSSPAPARCWRACSIRSPAS